MLHGYAVAWGMVCELYLSHIRCGFPKEALRTTIQFIKENYGSLYFTCDDYECLYDFMKHDKKNASCGVINFTSFREESVTFVSTRPPHKRKSTNCLISTAKPWDKFCRVQTAFKRNLKILRNYCGKYLVIPNKAVPCIRNSGCSSARFRVRVWGACGRWFESSHPD